MSLPRSVVGAGVEYLMSLLARVVGSSIGLPGLWVLAAVTVGASVGSLLGVLLSVPIASILYTLLRRNVRKRLDGPERKG